MSLTIGSLFSGAGGFEMGFEAAGFRTAWQCEIDPDAVSVLERHWPDVRRYHDVRGIDPSDLEPVDVVTAGFPCQPFSVAGNRMGQDDERFLFPEILRIVREMREATNGRYPAVVVLENVPGLLSSHGGRDFAAVFAGLRQLGAAVAGRILDAQFFGVPQRRRRVFITADFAEPGVGERRASQVLALSESVRGDSKTGREAWQRITRGVEGSAGSGGELAPCMMASGAGKARTGGSDFCLPTVAHALTAHGGSHGRIDAESETFVVGCEVADTLSVGANQTTGFVGGDVAHTITASAGYHGHSSPRGDGSDNLVAAFSVRHSDRDLSPVSACLQADTGATGNMLPAILTGIDWQQAGSSVEDGTPTLTTTRTPAVGGRPGMSVRRLMPTEAEALMGWPRDHTRWRADGREIPDGPRYRLCGNGVVAPVAFWIAHRLRIALEAGT